MADGINIFAPELRNQIKKELPFVQGAYVTFYDDITVGAVSKAQEAQKNQDIDLNLDLILNQIADWNFADKDGLLPINMDSLKRLPMKYLTWMAQVQGDLLQVQEDPEAKKN